ncbi:MULTISPECIES: N-acetylglucosamine-6-phosphate deacetylase [unclassified Clostridioides]|uniref:N-acetylglucosamine-6-phosphate deacetylase n=1 Tax=unclassified Clostridioides TaxID=2635829 RepID=UPI001D0C0DBC|nr:N-acetylglucosamine-6-phosphate deacetylase [Clostridioides sp. ES-S-0001-02]MCC0641693.1 N-acetylglucosamine-6-phosphate deacetylase [Clostridioides sp. ES-S-0049-03]MCC0653145.1 N-acetylglucosamine-6-phosphate deacetylase [Clostridioides sp. ES-S-0001-03]MCC0656849.1 N-acetylglucosamine-6-phosphate deacetylase [Clostridioides sp. ES-S-0123-01]MCC0673419.1 N-acetylglucosamine-6-phosphate deacetylase [Clostridioides sp. ES-S-0145-01]MCC0676226.1 N-acetylglucosamine-6-phosphate deacetylase [
MKCLINGKIILKNQILENKVLVFDEKIIDISDEIPNDCEVIDVGGKYISPGLIDIHIHGNMGKDTMDSTDESIETISKSIMRHGVTSFLPTTMTMDKEHVYDALEVIKKAKSRKLGGAQVLGAHLEGPFINENYKGAQNEKFIINSKYEFIKEYKNVIKVITYAPEKDIDFDFTREIKRCTNIVLSIGHSNASYEQAKEAINLGVTNITHMFNAMTGLNHRDPGVVGAALTTDVYSELIADTIHINKDLFQFILNNKGREKLILITDSIEAGGLEDGNYALGGQKVIVKGNEARLENGALAGSVLSLNKMVLNFLNNTNLRVNEAINLASLNPATSLGINDKKGSLDIGKDADIAVFDENLDCKMTLCLGEVVYKNM